MSHVLHTGPSPTLPAHMVGKKLQAVCVSLGPVWLVGRLVSQSLALKSEAKTSFRVQSVSSQSVSCQLVSSESLVSLL